MQGLSAKSFCKTKRATIGFVIFLATALRAWNREQPEDGAAVSERTDIYRWQWLDGGACLGSGSLRGHLDPPFHPSLATVSCQTPETASSTLMCKSATFNFSHAVLHHRGTHKPWGRCTPCRWASPVFFLGVRGPLRSFGPYFSH